MVNWDLSKRQWAVVGSLALLRGGYAGADFLEVFSFAIGSLVPLYFVAVAIANIGGWSPDPDPDAA